MIFAAIVVIAIVLRRRDEPETLPARQGDAGGFFDPSQINRSATTAILIGIPAIWVAWTLFASVHMISAGHVGVVYTFGDVTGQVGAGLQTGCATSSRASRSTSSTC